MQSVLPRLLAGALLVVALDQASKSYFSSHPPIPLLPGVVSLAVTYNPGIAFSIPVPSLLLPLLTVVVLTTFVVVFLQRVDISFPAAKVALVLVVGGGVGNLIDRLLWGTVVDFIAIGPFPVFNIADMAVVLGACLLVWKHPIIQRFPKKTNTTIS